MERKESVTEASEYNGETIDISLDDFPEWDDRLLSDELVAPKKRSPGVDKPFLVITLLLLMIGLIMVLSASFARGYHMMQDPMFLFSRQLVFAISGVAIMLVTSRISIRIISKWSMHLLFASIGTLVLVLMIGNTVNGATRWLGIGDAENSFLTFQPSEITKLAVVLAYAQIACKFGSERMKMFKFGVVPFAVITGVIIVLLRFQPHLSAIIIITAITVIMMFAGGTNIRWFLIAVAILTSMVLGFLYFQLRAVPEVEIRDVSVETIRYNIDFMSMGYEGRRIAAWLDPDADPLGAGFQTRQSLNAVGSGGLLGLGLGQSRQKHLYLPEEHNDYIFAIVGEELGFIGAMLILMLFALLVIRGFWLALNANDKFSALITIGLSSLLALQVFLNVAVVVNLLPATGISLPFFSYGGTALWLQMVQIGIILSVSREIPIADEAGEGREMRVPS